MFGGTHAVFDGGPSVCGDNDLTDGKAQEPHSHSERWKKPSSLCLLSFSHPTRPEQSQVLGAGSHASCVPTLPPVTAPDSPCLLNQI